MADSIAVFPPGTQLRHKDTDEPLSGGRIEFFDAGTTTPKTVYADQHLTTSLGTFVTCDAMGRPTSDGSSPTSIYVGTASYKVLIKDSGLVTIETKDNLKGAYETFSPGSLTVVATTPVVTKSLNYTVVSGDQSTVFVGNCSGGDVAFTLPSASAVGTGWFVTVQHAGSANQCTFETISLQTISEGSKNFGTSYVLAHNGEEARIVSDGSNWRIVNHTAPITKTAQGVITIVSRTNTPPGSPQQGDQHIVTTGPTGAWASFAVGDIAKQVGDGWINFTPPSNGGWLAWVQAENLQYRYSGTAWVSETATTAVAGVVRLADTTAMEGQTAGRGVTADVQHRHPLHPKAWISFNGTGTIAILADIGFASISDGGVGIYTATMDQAMSSVNYAVAFGAAGPTSGSVGVAGGNSAPTATVLNVRTFGYNSGTLDDCAYVSATVLGDW